jgi:hypothetical protein
MSRRAFDYEEAYRRYYEEGVPKYVLAYRYGVSQSAITRAFQVVRGKLRQLTPEENRRRNTRDGKTCPDCGRPITNYSEHCRDHAPRVSVEIQHGTESGYARCRRRPAGACESCRVAAAEARAIRRGRA